MTARGLRPQAIVTALLPAVVQAEIAVEVSPVWLLRPGRAEAVRWWPLLCQVYGELTGLELLDVAPPRERRRVDVVLRYPDGAQQVLEVDESQHFTGPRAVTLTAYPDQVALGFPHDLWLTRARERTGREPGGGFGRPCPPLFPEPGGRHSQRAFRDMLADLLPLEHGWLPTIRISDTETAGWTVPGSEGPLAQLLAGRGISAEHLLLT